MALAAREAPGSTPHTGHLIIGLIPEAIDWVRAWVAHHGDSFFGSLTDFANEAALPGLLPALPDEAAVPTRPLGRGVPPRRMLELEDSRPTHSAQRYSLTLYWKLDTRKLSEGERRALMERLSTAHEVRVAYQEVGYVTAAPVPQGGNDPLATQDYLKLAPQGIGAEGVWYAYDGTGIGFGDVENQWNLKHQDLDRLATGLSDYQVKGSMRDTLWADHGTAVLGIVVGVDNATPVMGIAPLTHDVLVYSNFDGIEVDLESTLSRVWNELGVGGLSVGDILLLEAQTADSFPVEVDLPVFDLIQALTEKGLVLVEPAGNAGKDLDLAPWVSSYFPNRKTQLIHGDHDYDTGAILVGGCMAAVVKGKYHERRANSNSGARVDCYAWAEQVFTAGAYDGTTRAASRAAAEANLSTNYSTFSGTSAASAIIAGAAILTQQMSVAAGTLRLGPDAMRTCLGSPLDGTSQDTTSVSGNIGVMPNLVKIGQRLGAVPDPMLLPRPHKLPSRDRFDPADRPFRSVDILVQAPRHTPVGIPFVPAPNPFQPTPHVVQLPQVLLVGMIFVRIHNLGRLPIPGVKAAVYSARPSPLVPPSTWHLIGESLPVDLPANGTALAGPIPWTVISPNQIVPEPHTSLVAVLNHSLDPALIGPATSWRDFLEFLPQDNNVAWRNTASVTTAAAPARQVRLPDVFLQGNPPIPLRFMMRILHDLPAAVTLSIGAPAGLNGGWELMPRRGVPRLAEFNLLLDTPVPIELSLGIGNAAPAGNYSIVLSQHFKGDLVGEFTWFIGIT